MPKRQDTYYKWKIIAIIVISLLILENLFFLWAYFDSEDDSKKEAMCLTKYCTVGKFDAYGYDRDTQICTCFKDNKAVEQHFIE